jgi:D-threo-aldose 1-dehydrogenase
LRLELPPFGLGGAAIGNLYRAVSVTDAVATVHAALEAGLSYIDTAPYYGHGRSEARIGMALREWGGAKPSISTKVGRVLEPDPSPGDFGFADPLPFRPRFDYSRASVRRSLEGSLERLGVARVDIVLVHDIGRAEHGPDYEARLRCVLDETLPELEAMRREGLLGWIGVGVNEPGPVLDLLGRAPLDCALIAGRYTLLEQPALDALERCAEAGVRVIAGGVFNSGLLASSPSPASTYNYAPAPDAVLARARAIWAVCGELGAAPQAAALHFPLTHRAVASVVVGARSAREVAEIAAWRDGRLPPRLFEDLQSQGFIAEGAPIDGRGAPCA